MRAGVPRNELKRSFLLRFGLTARQFNAIRIELEGKIASIQERRPEWIEETKGRIKRAEEAIGRLEEKKPGSSLLHQKKRRLAILRTKLETLLADQESGQVRLCFGSRRLFRKQFALEESGYVDHAAWKKDWQTERSSQFLVLGSKDETAGNQSCQAVAEPDGSLRLRLRLPDGLGGPSKHLVLEGVRFAYGQEAILQALSASRLVTAQTKTGKLVRKREGSAVSYRFVRDRSGWRVFVSVEAQPVALVTRRLAGAVGLDINEDHLAVAETERFGNLVRIRRLGLNLYGKSEEQAKAIIGNACREIVRACTESGKPLVIERLDLCKRKVELESVDPVRARSLSSFSYAKAISMLKAASFRAGVEVIEVNPAYTSVIGAVNHARRHGIGSHQGAAYAVARRGLGLSERPSVREAIDCLPRLCPRKRGHWALPGLCRRNPGTRTVGSTVRPASWTIYPGRGMIVYGFRNGGSQVIKKGCDHGTKAVPMDDLVDQAFLVEELRSLKAVGKLLVRGFPDDPGSRKTDHGLGFGENDVSQGSEACRHSRHRRVGQNR